MFGLTTLGQAPFGTAGGEPITSETVSLPLVVTVAHTQPDAATIWDIRVLLADQDITDNLTGQVVIEAEESAARIATVKLLLTGQRLSDLTGKPLIVEMRPNMLASWQRRFTGIVDTPEFGQDRDFVTLHARDRRSESLAQASRAELEALLGGYWSQHVFARYADSLQYANDRLSTLPAAYDLDVYGNPRLTPWAGLTSSLTLHAGDIVDESLSIQPSSHKSVINLVTNDNESEQTISTTAICKLSDGKTVTTSTQPTIIGVATAGMTVTVKVGGQTLTATAGAGGSWSAKVSRPLADGRYTPCVTLTYGSIQCAMWGTPFQVARNGKGTAIIGQAAQERVVDCSLQYRYPRLHEYRRTYTWSMGMSYAAFAQGNNGKPYKLPEKSLFKSAAESSSWKLLSEFYTPPLQGQHYVGYIDSSGNLHDGDTVPSDAAAVLWYRNDYTGKVEDDPRCESAVIAIAKRVVQTLTERWRITVRAPDSIAALGEMKKQGQTASIDASSAFDASAWTDSTTMLPEVGTTSVDLTSLADGTREDANLAIQTLAAIARRQILESHRLTRVKFSLPINPALDTSRAITVDRPDLLASGKIARLTETYDLTAGSALAAVELAISGLVGVGTVDSDPLKSPELEALPSQSQADSADLGTCLEGRSPYSTSTTGYTTGASGDAASDYPHEVAIAVPEIPVYLTDPVSRELAYTVSVAIPVDRLEFRS